MLCRKKNVMISMQRLLVFLEKPFDSVDIISSNRIKLIVYFCEKCHDDFTSDRKFAVATSVKSKRMVRRHFFHIASQSEKISFTYLHSLLWSRGFVGRIQPLVHFEHRRVLAFVDNSSKLLHRSHEHQKNLASNKCCLRFKVPCGVNEKRRENDDEIVHRDNVQVMGIVPAEYKHSSVRLFRLS